MKIKDDEAVVGCISVLIMLFAVPFGWVWRGWVVRQLWMWFAVPALHLPVITVAQAIGLWTLLGILMPMPNVKAEEGVSPADACGKALAHAVLWPAATLFFGWCVHHFA